MQVFAVARVAADSYGPNGARAHVAIEDVSWQHRNPFTQQLPVEPTTGTLATPSHELEACQPRAAHLDSQPSTHTMPTAPATAPTQPPSHRPTPAGDSPIDTRASEERDPPEAGADATGNAEQLGRGRRTRKLTTKMAAAGADGATTVARAPPQPAPPPRAKVAKRARDDSPDRKASPDGNSDTTAAFLRQPTPPAATATASTSAVLRVKRARKGNPVRASE